MTQVPILNGVYTDAGPDIRTAYPVNLVPVPRESGISQGYLRPADGLVSNGTGPGIGRGGINWNGSLYRVMGTKLVKISSTGAATTLGSVGSGGLVSMDYSFDRLAVASGGRLYYWDGTDLTRVTNGALGECLDVVWVDGYFMSTDGTSLVVTELNDPTDVNPLKYGSSEADPDPVKALKKIRNEVYALNRYTTELFNNVGGQFFPFQRIEGAQIQKGCLGTHACCVFLDALAFLGSGRNEPPAVYVGANGQANKISTREVETLLLDYTEDELSTVKLEARTDKANKHLYLHLPDRTLVFDGAASAVANEPVWFHLTSATGGFSQYLGRDFVWCYDQWLVANPATTQVGYADSSVGSHWGDKVRWEFSTAVIYNASRGAIVNELELIATPGRMALGDTPTIVTSYSDDGLTWSQDIPISVGSIGDRLKRLVWRRQGRMRNWRIQRFQGDSSVQASFLRLEAQFEPLAV